MVTVVITGADHPTGLGIARCLKGTGCEIIGLCANEKHFCCHSNCWDKLIPYGGFADIYDVLIDVGKSAGGKKVLFPSQDSVVKLISENREELGKYYELSLPGKKEIDLLLDKTKFQLWAEEHDFNIPISAICTSPKEYQQAIEKIGFPLLIKPFEKTEKWDQLSPSYKILKINSMQEVESIGFDLFEAADKLLVQQWIPGSDANVYFCLVCYGRNGKLVEKFTGRKLFQAPPYCGSTAAAVGVENSEVDDITTRLFDLVGYKGLGSLEVKKSDKDGKYYLVEPTVGRNDLQSNVALSGGVNLSHMALADLTSVDPPQCSLRKSAWICEESLGIALCYYIKKRKLNVFTLLPLVRWNCCFTLISWSDFKPFRKWFFSKLKNVLRRYF